MTDINITQIFLGLLSIVTAALGWFARQLWDAVQKLRQDLNNLEVKIGSDYVRYDRMQDAFKPIMQALEEIKETLRTKADK